MSARGECCRREPGTAVAAVDRAAKARAAAAGHAREEPQLGDLPQLAAAGSVVEPRYRLGHHGFGTVIHPNVVIGRRVKIWQNVTIAMRAGAKSPYRIFIEDDVKIGANAVVISPYRANLRIGRGARIGAGAVVNGDVPRGQHRRQRAGVADRARREPRERCARAAAARPSEIAAEPARERACRGAR